MSLPIGEEAWVSRIEEKKSSARELEQRVELFELCQQATSTEPYSLRLWLEYCEYVWSLYEGSQDEAAGWSEEERLLGQELFGLETALNVWKHGAAATRFRLSDSHELWNRWIAIEIALLDQNPNAEQTHAVKELFIERLQTPHATWDETSQAFSQFLTKYDEPSWEQTMIEVTKLAKHAKSVYEAREMFELKLRNAISTGEREAIWSAAKPYLDWEDGQLRKKNQNTWGICIALHERILGLFSDTAMLWQEYITLIGTQHTFHKGKLPESPELLSVVQRATSHCSWSGSLWARYLLQAEIEELEYTAIDQIKDSAIAQIPPENLGDVIDVYAAWCTYLKRRVMLDRANSEAIDQADSGFRAALESLNDTGKRLFGQSEFKGDPAYRLERLFIQYLSERGLDDEARAQWKKLASIHGNSYEFWQRYYIWEIMIWTRAVPMADEALRPELATAVLTQALSRKNLDWPEKIMEILLQHASNYENAQNESVLRDQVQRVSNGVVKRRQRESAAIESQQVVDSTSATGAISEPMDVESSTSGTTKRKRIAEDEDTPAKKMKENHLRDGEADRQKRDRENTTVIVSNLPANITQTKVRQYFKEYGHINSLSLQVDDDGQSSIAMIEFRSTEDVKSAMIRDGKYLDDHQIRVRSGAGLTLYVTNYPPTADENYMRELFKDCGEILSIRWPSLKYNTHRRFCYVTFRTTEGASSATQLDGTVLEDRYTLEAKYSDPSRKKTREGALSEGRELHVANIERNTTEEELREIFGKFGPIESVRILKTLAGKNKGGGFVIFESKEDAISALTLDKTQFRGQILTVELAKASNYKPVATATQPAETENQKNSPSQDIEMTDGPSKEEIINRTVALINVPDTFNDARVRTLVEPYGTIVKLTLRPDHQGAIVEFTDAVAAGKASLGLYNHEIAPGRHLRTGSVKQLLQEKSEYRQDRIQTGASKSSTKSVGFIQPNNIVRRPVVRGGRGVKRGLGFVASAAKSSPSTTTAESLADEGKAKSKTNAEFRALINGAKTT